MQALLYYEPLLHSSHYDVPRVWMALGACFRQEGRIDDAIGLYCRVHEAHTPRSPPCCC